MKQSSILSFIFFLLIGCAASQHDLRVKAVFRSTDTTLKLINLKGLDMGELYGYDFQHRPKIGKYETRYVSRDDVKLSEEIELQWKRSTPESTEIYEQVIERPEGIPKLIPKGSKLIFLHSEGSWTLSLEPLLQIRNK